MYFLLPLITVIIWSGNAIVNILSVDVIAPETISFYRWFIALMTLTASCGCEVEIEAKGSDAQEAGQAIADLINNKFDEE